MRVGMMILAMLVLLLVGCDDGCEKNATRCNGDRAEMCSSGGEWELIADCSEIEGAAFLCCADPVGGYNCMLAEECAPPDAGADAVADDLMVLAGEIRDDAVRAQDCYPCCPWFNGLETWAAQAACCAANHLAPCNPPAYTDLGGAP